MQSQGIKRICCLLSASQLVTALCRWMRTDCSIGTRGLSPLSVVHELEKCCKYGNLVEIYEQTFGAAQICWAPIEDFHLVNPEILLSQILPFLMAADQNQEKVVVHCSGGIGRTGYILVAWLVAGRGFSPQAAIAVVKQTGRNPYEAVIAAPFNGRNPRAVLAELNNLLNECKGFSNRG